MDDRSNKNTPVIRQKRELAYTGKIISVYKDYVKIGDRETVWDYIHHDGAAAVVPVCSDGRIMMVKQYRNALDRYTLEIPAGKVDSPDEPRVLCAYRELEEETGYKAKNPDSLEFLIRINTTVAFCDEEIDIFIAENLEKTSQNLDEDEDINVERWELLELLEKIWRGEIKDAKTVAALTAYAVKRKK